MHLNLYISDGRVIGRKLGCKVETRSVADRVYRLGCNVLGQPLEKCKG
jgi:hypothetical protein